MKAIAIDDEPIALDIIRSHASKVPFLDLKATYTDAFEALEYLQKEKVDLIFLDIKMPDISGIEFFQSLRVKPLLIFTTAYSEHAVTSFDLDAVDYLLKPFSFSRFLKASNKALELFEIRNPVEKPDSIFIKSGYDQYKISFSDIDWLEASGNYITFVVNEKKILSRSTFAEVMELLPEDQFVRVHRSYVVAVHKIQKVERNQVFIKSNKIPVSESYRNALNSSLRSK